MVREAMRERFLETLKESGGSAGNSRLRSELGWQEDTYWTVHAALVEDGTVVAGRGRGGSVARVNGESTRRRYRRRASLGGQARRRASQRACPAQSRQRRQPLRATFKNIDDVLWKEAGCTTELDYTEQTSWLLFLKYLDGLEQDQADRGRAGGQEIHLHPRQAATAGKRWAAPKRQGRQARPQQGADRRRPARLRQSASSSPTCTASSRRPPARTPSNTRSAKSSARSRTRSRAATTCARSSTTSTSCASARRPRSTSSRTSTKPRSRTWATPGATAASITRRARSSAPWSKWCKPKIGERIYDGAVRLGGLPVRVVRLPARPSRT